MITRDVQHLSADALHRLILKEAMVRAACWRLGIVEEANELTKALNAHWPLWRSKRGEATGISQPKPKGVIDYKPVAAADPVDRFIQTRCVVEDHVTTPTRDIHSALITWAKDEGEAEVLQISAMRLTRELQRRGIERSRTKDARLYTGLRLAA